MLYEDDILLMASAVTELQRLFLCETEPKWLNMTIHAKLSCYIATDPPYNVNCVCLKAVSDLALPWGAYGSLTWYICYISYVTRKHINYDIIQVPTT